MTFPRGVVLGVVAMTVIVVASNVLVQYPINDWLTWGALTYPVTFLVTDLINRGDGPRAARRVVYVGFAVAAIASIYFAGPRIAFASADVIDSKHGSRDDQNNERKKGDTSQAVKRVPVPNDTEFVFLGVRQ